MPSMHLLMAFFAKSNDVVRRRCTSILIIDQMMSFHMIVGTTDLTYVAITLLFFSLRFYMCMISSCHIHFTSPQSVFVLSNFKFYACFKEHDWLSNCLVRIQPIASVIVNAVPALTAFPIPGTHPHSTCAAVLPIVIAAPLAQAACAVE